MGCGTSNAAGGTIVEPPSGASTATAAAPSTIGQSLSSKFNPFSTDSTAKQLRIAAHAGDTQALRAIIGKKGGVSAKDLGTEKDKVAAPLALAAQSGVVAAVQVLLDAGALIDLRDENGETALGAAAKLGRKEVVQVLLERGADKEAGVPLVVAVKEGHVAVAAALIAFGADPNVADARGATAALLACRHASPELLRAVFDTPQPLAGQKEVVNVNVADCTGDTALAAALAAPEPGTDQKTTEVVRMLLQAGANPQLAMPGKALPLLLAAQHGKAGAVALLLDHGADPVVQSGAEQRTALHAACLGPAPPHAISALLTHGAPPGAKDILKATPLMLACRAGNVAATQALIDGVKNVADLRPQERTSDLGHTALHCAAGALDCGPQHGECVRLLLCLQPHVDINQRDNGGATPVAVAAAHGNLPVLSALVAAGADLDAVDDAKRSPVFHATVAGNMAVLEKLLRAKANPNGACAVDWKDGATPFILACQSPTPAVASLFLREGNAARVQLEECDRKLGRTPLLHAAAAGNANLCKALIDAGAYVTAVASEGEGAVALAAGHAPTVAVLLANGADATAKDRSGRSVLWYGLRAAAPNLQVGEAVVCAGAQADNLLDLQGLGWYHRAVLERNTAFMHMWAAAGGDPEALTGPGATLPSYSAAVPKCLQGKQVGVVGPDALAALTGELKTVQAAAALQGRLDGRALRLAVHGARLCAQDQGRESEAVAGYERVAAFLLMEGADPEAAGPSILSDPVQDHPLVWWMKGGWMEMVQRAVRMGADTEVAYESPEAPGAVWTPLIHAAHAGKVDLVATLLQAGADPNKPATGKAGGGLTALLAAIRGGHACVAGLLLEAGAAVNGIKGSSAPSPIQQCLKEVTEWPLQIEIKDAVTAACTNKHPPTPTFGEAVAGKVPAAPPAARQWMRPLADAAAGQQRLRGALHLEQKTTLLQMLLLSGAPLQAWKPTKLLDAVLKVVAGEGREALAWLGLDPQGKEADGLLEPQLSYAHRRLELNSSKAPDLQDKAQKLLEGAMMAALRRHLDNQAVFREWYEMEMQAARGEVAEAHRAAAAQHRKEKAESRLDAATKERSHLRQSWAKWTSEAPAPTPSASAHSLPVSFPAGPSSAGPSTSYHLTQCPADPAGTVIGIPVQHQLDPISHDNGGKKVYKLPPLKGG